MSAFKNMVQEDIKDVFLDFDIFGENHRLNGKKTVVIVDENELIDRASQQKDEDRELHNRRLLFYVAGEDFGKLPIPGKILNFDGRNYLITDAVDESGIYSISLEATESW